MHVEMLVTDLERRGIHGLALDIDETLADTNTHFFTHTFRRHPIPGIALDALMRRYKFSEDVPEWKEPEVRITLEEFLHSDAFHASIPVIPGASESVRLFPESAPVVAYVTARPEELRRGTEEWLERHEFPKAPVLMRTSDGGVPDSTIRNRWKIGVLQALWPRVTGIVDDNLGLAHELERTDYPGRLYLYGPRGDACPVHPRIRACPTWPDVVAAVSS